MGLPSHTVASVRCIICSTFVSLFADTQGHPGLTSFHVLLCYCGLQDTDEYEDAAEDEYLDYDDEDEEEEELPLHLEQALGKY